MTTATWRPPSLAFRPTSLDQRLGLLLIRLRFKRWPIYRLKLGPNHGMMRSRPGFLNDSLHPITKNSSHDFLNSVSRITIPLSLRKHHKRCYCQPTRTHILLLHLWPPSSFNKEDTNLSRCLQKWRSRRHPLHRVFLHSPCLRRSILHSRIQHSPILHSHRSVQSETGIHIVLPGKI